MHSLRDWRYAVVSRVRPADLIIVDFAGIKPGLNTRADLIHVIQEASDERALGVALDMYLNKTSEPPVDTALCAAVASAAVPVFGGYNVVVRAGRPEREPYAAVLEPCFGADRRGHLWGYVEGDGRVRSIPLHLGGVRALESLDLEVARSILRREPDLPSDDLLRIVPPSAPFETVRALDLLFGDSIPVQALEGKFVLVGRNIPADSVDTPDGRESGTIVHANAIHSLVTGTYFRHFDSAATESMTLILCAYLLTLLVDRGTSTRSVLLTTGGVSMGLVLAALLAARAWVFWVDFEYTLAGLWGWTLIVLAARLSRSGGTPNNLEQGQTP